MTAAAPGAAAGTMARGIAMDHAPGRLWSIVEALDRPARAVCLALLADALRGDGQRSLRVAAAELLAVEGIARALDGSADPPARLGAIIARLGAIAVTIPACVVPDAAAGGWRRSAWTGDRLLEIVATDDGWFVRPGVWAVSWLSREARAVLARLATVTLALDDGRSPSPPMALQLARHLALTQAVAGTRSIDTTVGGLLAAIGHGSPAQPQSAAAARRMRARFEAALHRLERLTLLHSAAPAAARRRHDAAPRPWAEDWLATRLRLRLAADDDAA